MSGQPVVQGVPVNGDLWAAVQAVAAAQSDTVRVVVRDALWAYVVDSGLFVVDRFGALQPADGGQMSGHRQPGVIPWWLLLTGCGAFLLSAVVVALRIRGQM